MCFVVAYVLIEYFLLRRRSGQTLGKGLLGLRVISLDGTPHGAVSARSGLLRMAFLIGPFILSTAVFYITYEAATETSDSAAYDALLVLWMAVIVATAIAALADRSRHRGLHDLLAGTRVVRTQPRGIDLGRDLKMLVPGKVNLEKDAPVVNLTKRP